MTPRFSTCIALCEIDNWNMQGYFQLQDKGTLIVECLAPPPILWWIELTPPWLFQQYVWNKCRKTNLIPLVYYLKQILSAIFCPEDLVTSFLAWMVLNNWKVCCKKGENTPNLPSLSIRCRFLVLHDNAEPFLLFRLKADLVILFRHNAFQFIVTCKTDFEFSDDENWLFCMKSETCLLFV